MSYKILAINPGSTSTKVAVYDDGTELFSTNLPHSQEELAPYRTVADQFEMRRDRILAYLRGRDFDLGQLAAVVGRGGMLPPVKSGAYRVNETMVDRLRNRPVQEHASNLGALIAYEIAVPLGIEAYIYDSVKVDEFIDIARFTGLPEIPRTSISHALNARAMAMRCAREKGSSYSALRIIVAHLGGGISLSLHDRGRMVDVIPDNEGPFSPERAGRIPTTDLINLCFSGTYDRRALHKRVRGGGGLVAYLGTVDMREVERMGQEGDARAALLLDAMCYQVAKGIGELATVVCGKVDYIILTGGIAYSELVTSKIAERVRFIAPVELLPGENEMESLASGTLRVLRGEELAREYEE